MNTPLLFTYICPPDNWYDVLVSVMTYVFFNSRFLSYSKYYIWWLYILFVESYLLLTKAIYNLLSEKRISRDNILLKDNSVLKTGDFIEICYDEKVDFVPL